MVTQRKMIAIEEVKRLLKSSDDIDSALEKVDSIPPSRQPAPPCPERGISLSAAKRKYKVHHQTISRWVAAKRVPIILRTPKHLYVDEVILAQVIHTYKKNPGRGKKTVKQNLKAA